MQQQSFSKPKWKIEPIISSLTNPNAKQNRQMRRLRGQMPLRRYQSRTRQSRTTSSLPAATDAEHALPNAHSTQLRRCTSPTPKLWLRSAQHLKITLKTKSSPSSATGAATQAQTSQALADSSTRQACEPSVSCARAESTENSSSKHSGSAQEWLWLAHATCPTTATTSAETTR